MNMPKNLNKQNSLNFHNNGDNTDLPDPSSLDTRRLYYKNQYQSELEDIWDIEPQIAEILVQCRNNSNHIIEAGESLAQDIEQSYHELQWRKIFIENKLNNALLWWNDVKIILKSQKEIATIKQEAMAQLKNPYFPEDKKIFLENIISESILINDIIWESLYFSQSNND